MRFTLPARSAALAVGSALFAGLLTGCQLTESNDPTTTDGSGKIGVSSTDDDCEVTASETPAGTLVFEVTNDGSKTTEFYLYAADGKRIIGEVENVTPGLTRDLVVAAKEGDYVTSCRPGMTGQGIRADFTVTKGDGAVAPAGVTDAAIKTATNGYGEYVRQESATLLKQTARFVRLYTSGKDDAARTLYPRARVHWERIETVAESFGDLDPRMDAREADLEPGQKWTGWHRIEKDLWPPKGDRPASINRKAMAGMLLKDTTTLDSRLADMEFTLDQIGNGSKGLLDEVATGKVTGEEEIWSHTDLYDFQANVDGARVAFDLIEPILLQKDKELAAQITRRFDELQQLLDRYRQGDQDFVFYDEVGKAERRELSDAVNALAEPLSRLTGAVTL